MLEKFKEIGSQVANKANDTADGLTTSVKGGFGKVATKVADVADKINDITVRSSTAQMCDILETAIKEIKTRPQSVLSAQPISLTVTMSTGIASLEMQVHLQASENADLEQMNEVHS